MSFGRSFVKSSKKTPLCRLEIRTDADFVVFRGGPDATEPQKLKGRIILMNSETIDAKSIKITLEGKRRTSHNVTIKELDAGITALPANIRTKHTFHHDEQLLQPSSLKIPPANHEFPFEFELPGDACESIEGFSPSLPLFQIYQLHAVIERRLGVKDLTETKHIRVIRTLGNNPEELLDPESISGNWVDKIMYEWSISTKSLIFGDKVTVDFALTPLADKLRIGKIKFYIRENVKIKTDPGLQDCPIPDLGNMWEEVHNVAEQILEPPDEFPEDLHPVLMLEQRKFSMTFELPKSLNECRQSVDSGDWIHIRHRLHVSILLHNADGHLSELKAHMPIRLYISPRLPIGDNNTVSTLTTSYSSSSLQAQATATPPAYSSHTHDVPLNPFDEISTSGFVTPAVGSRSGAVTPGRPHFNREASTEQVPESLDQPGPLPHDLSARLERLQTLSQVEEGAEENAENAQHVDYDLRELERITSYQTAIRNPGPANYSNLPPTYADATSTPPSPQFVLLQPAHRRYGQTNGAGSH